MHGNVIGIANPNADLKTQTMIQDAQGRILRKDAVRKSDSTAAWQDYYYVNGNPIGSNGTLEADTFDYNYTAVSDRYPPTNAGQYVVQGGDTLNSVAQVVFGDASLWYLLADANGLTTGPSGALTVGQTLTIPNRVSNLHNDSTTFKPYQAGDILGDNTPVLKAPKPPKQKCGALAQIVMVAVVIVASIYTAGLAASFTGMAAFGGGASVMTGGLAGTAAAGLGTGTIVTAAAVGGAAGSIAGQLAGQALGVDSNFSWSRVAVGGLTAAATAGIANTGVVGNLVGSSRFLQGAAAGGLNNVANQGINVALRQQDSFSWTALAAASITSGIGAQFGDNDALNQVFGDPNMSAFGFTQVAQATLRNTAYGLLNRSTQVAIQGHGKIDIEAISADAFGNALGNSIVGQIQQAAAEKQAAEIEQGIARQSQVDNEQLDAVIAQSNQEFSDQIETDFNAGVDRDLDLFAAQQTESRLVSDSVAGFSSPNLRGLTHQAANVNFEVAALNQSQSGDGAPFYIDRNSAGDERARGFNSQLAAALNSYGDTYAEGLEPKPIVQGWFGGGFTAGGSLSLGKMFEVEAAVDFGSATANVFDWNGDRTAMQQFELSATIAGISLGFELERSGPTLADLGPWKFVPHVFDVELSNHDFVLEIENKNLFRTGVSANLSEIGRQTESYMNRQVAQLITASYKQSMPEANLPHTDLSEYIRRQEIDKAD